LQLWNHLNLLPSLLITEGLDGIPNAECGHIVLRLQPSLSIPTVHSQPLPGRRQVAAANHQPTKTPDGVICLRFQTIDITWRFSRRESELVLVQTDLYPLTSRSSFEDLVALSAETKDETVTEHLSHIGENDLFSLLADEGSRQTDMEELEPDVETGHPPPWIPSSALTAPEPCGATNASFNMIIVRIS